MRFLEKSIPQGKGEKAFYFAGGDTGGITVLRCDFQSGASDDRRKRAAAVLRMPENESYF